MNVSGSGHRPQSQLPIHLPRLVRTTPCLRQLCPELHLAIEEMLSDKALLGCGGSSVWPAEWGSSLCRTSYNYGVTTEIGWLLVPQLQQQIEAEHPLGCRLHCGPMYWAEWQAFGVVPWHWAETISLCRVVQFSMQAEAIQLWSRHDMAQWLQSFHVASRRCRRHALMALMHLVVGMLIAEQLAPAISPWGRLMHRFLLPPAVRITANVLR